jgi:hypothetical protein
VKEANFKTKAFAHTQIYAAWETDEIIGFELWRNLGLAMLCVFVVTFVLLVNFPICLMVLICVILTLVDIVGFLHFWDITIDTLSMINIVLAIGLCVDYSVHIAHAFLVSKGSRVERATQALTDIGPAVLNGGFTTFLAISLLIFSSSHVFITFFKVFLLTVMFGLYHGLIFLPVILAMVGPLPSDCEKEGDSNCNTSTDSRVSPCDSGTSSPNSGTISPESGGEIDSSRNHHSPDNKPGTRKENGFSSNGTTNMGFVGGDGNVEARKEKLDQPVKKSIFSKKASYDVNGSMLY